MNALRAGNLDTTRAIAAAVLVSVAATSCGGGSSALPLHNSAGGSNVTSRLIERPNGGGAFGASYTGTVTSKSCGFKCTTQTFTGNGTATFIRKSRQSETLKIDCAVAGCNAIGNATLTSRKHPGNSITLQLQSNQGEVDSGNWGVLSGTGRFAHASGSGNWHTQYGTGTYTQTLSGTLNF